eukprot:CAMPEP_0177759808 /NCGR_PEP_ID=MMETSP0491_2-20121128/4927_1 /TAXON_ID=63592 /ORGANISM="Tetraselmis chuii, Strain PLY429" /LENGTH=151 /DNA_ID=CAMNT_0019275657 /DNA_START=234 /DNA_END=689 /DNA_ORIENTATION=+
MATALSVSAYSGVASCRALPRRPSRALRVIRAQGSKASKCEGGVKHVHPDSATMGCPDSESGFCEMNHTPQSMGCPDSETGLASQSFDGEALRLSRPHDHLVGHHLIHQARAGPALGCPESESGMCEVYESYSETPGKIETERDDLGAWEF